MSESDIAELCRKIYKQHRQAIDLIYEHRPDLRSEIEDFIKQLIQETAQQENIEQDSIDKRWIRFVPQEWDNLAFQKTCDGWTESRRILLFEFWNEPQKLELRLVIGPGDIKIKETIYQELEALNIAVSKKIRTIKEQGWDQVFTIQVLSYSDYEDMDLESLQEKIRAFWFNYIQGDMKLIREAIFNSFDKM